MCNFTLDPNEVKKNTCAILHYYVHFRSLYRLCKLSYYVTFSDQGHHAGNFITLVTSGYLKTKVFVTTVGTVTPPDGKWVNVVHCFICQEITFPWWWFIQIKWSHWKLNTKIYWYEQYIEKKGSCWNNYIVYRSDCNCMMYDLWNTFALPHDHLCTVFTRCSENVRRVKKILLSFLKHYFTLLQFVLFPNSSWQSVTISNTHVTTEHENKSS